MSDYELETLLDIREQERDDAEAEYARAVQELERRKRAVAELQDRHADLLASIEREEDVFDASISDVVDLQAMQNFDEYRSGVQLEAGELEQTIANAREDVREQEEVVEDAREVLAKAEQALAAVEKHREKWEAEREKRLRRKRSEEMDEIARRRWQENKE